MPHAVAEEHALGLTWVVAEPMERAFHALVEDGRVWLVDPLDGPEIEDAIALGEPAGVLQLLDRHNRDCAEIAGRLGVPHLKVPDAVPGSPFEAMAVVRVPGWKETALWWPEREALVVAEALAANPMHTGGSPTGRRPPLPARLAAGFAAALPARASAARPRALAARPGGGGRAGDRLRPCPARPAARPAAAARFGARLNGEELMH